jgi:hypothetical protein
MNVEARQPHLKLKMKCRTPPLTHWRKAEKREGPRMTFLLEVLAEALLSEIATALVAILLA